MLGAHVRPVAAVWILRRIDPSKVSDAVRFFRTTGRDDVADDLLTAWRELEAAAATWPSSVATSADGSAETTESPHPAGSEVVAVDEPPQDSSLAVELVEPAAAAAVLSVTEARVRQLLRDGSLAGEKIAGRWLIYPDSVEELVLRRLESREVGR